MGEGIVLFPYFKKRKGVGRLDFLTFEELEGLGFTDITQAEFDANVINATDAIHDLTNHHYHFNGFENDVKYRKDMFKKAIAAQIRLYNESGANTSYSMKQPQNVSIGRTTVNSGGGGGSDAAVASFSREAIAYLRPTGLLYRGL